MEPKSKSEEVFREIRRRTMRKYSEEENRPAGRYQDRSGGPTGRGEH